MDLGLSKSMRALLLLAIACQAFAACECGYSINSTSDDSYALFTDYVRTDFAHPTSNTLTFDNAPNYEWVAQVYNVSQLAARGPYGKAAETSNVIVNPEGLGLELIVRSRLIDLSSSEKMIPIAEVVNNHTNLLYGSFRAGLRTSNVSGTCAALFFYHNDSQEIDMESLSRQQNSSAHPINLVIQSADSVDAGFNAAGTADFVPYDLDFDPSEAYHEYRFDWMPGRVDMWADGKWLHSFIEGTPDSPGAIHLIHWSNGDPEWSGGPPAEDAVLMVNYVDMYFNSSSSSPGDGGLSCGSGGGEGWCQIGDGPVLQPSPHAPSASATTTPAPKATHKGEAFATMERCDSSRWLVWLSMILSVTMFA